MLTQTHALIGLALFARPRNTAVTMAALGGSTVPDLDVWIMFAVERVLGTPGCEIFHFRYLDSPWTSVQAIMNSLPLFATLLVMALVPLGSGDLVSSEGLRPFSTAGRHKTWPLLLAVFSASALIHGVIDFLLHHDDARWQLWPVSDYVFRSPVSYWDPDHFGLYFIPVEITLGLLLSFTLARRFPMRIARFLLVLACLGYGATVYASYYGAAVHAKGPGSCDARPDWSAWSARWWTGAPSFPNRE